MRWRHEIFKPNYDKNDSISIEHAVLWIDATKTTQRSQPAEWFLIKAFSTWHSFGVRPHFIFGAWHALIAKLSNKNVICSKKKLKIAPHFDFNYFYQSHLSHTLASDRAETEQKRIALILMMQIICQWSV